MHMLRLKHNNNNDLGSIYSSTTISAIFEKENIRKKLNLSEAFDYLNVIKFKDKQKNDEMQRVSF